jgi:hypothetical protein
LLRIAHIATGLARGGAETMLYRLLTATDRARFDPIVFSLAEAGALGDEIRHFRVPVRALGMRREVPSATKLLRLARTAIQIATSSACFELSTRDLRATCVLVRRFVDQLHR